MTCESVMRRFCDFFFLDTTFGLSSESSTPWGGVLAGDLAGEGVCAVSTAGEIGGCSIVTV